MPPWPCPQNVISWGPSMIQWFSMLAGWMVADALWWRAADQRLRPAKGARVWRGLVGAFMIAQLAYMVMMTVGSIVEHVPRGPLLWPVAAYVWHLFVLPAAVMTLLLARGVRWIQSRRNGEVAAPSVPSSSGHVAIPARTEPRPPISTDHPKISRRQAL